MHNYFINYYKYVHIKNYTQLHCDVIFNFYVVNILSEGVNALNFFFLNRKIVFWTLIN